MFAASKINSDYETLLMKQLSRQHIDYVAHCIGDNEKEFARLMNIVLHGKEPVVQRAAWAMDVCLEKHPNLLTPYVESLIKALSAVKDPDRVGENGFHNNGVKRLSLKALASRSIPEKYEGEMVDLCFRWMQASDVPVAIKVHCMQILANITERHPDLAEELRTVIIEQIPRNSVGFSSRGRKILKKFNNSS